MKVKDDVLGVLSRMEADGNTLRISDGQLDRKLYVSLNEVLTAMGGKWNRKTKGHVFSEDPASYLDNVLLTGEITRPKDNDYFPTPPSIVSVLVDLAEFRGEDDPEQYVTLEPSAGEGAIAEHIPFEFGSTLIEMDPRRAEVLKEKFPAFYVECADFMSWTTDEKFDRVVMNPPFSKQQDIDHVLRAFSFLKPGGRLVSVMSAGLEFRENKKTVEFRKFLDDHGGYWQPVEEGAFKESGTMVRTVIVRVDKAEA